MLYQRPRVERNRLDWARAPLETTDAGYRAYFVGPEKNARKSDWAEMSGLDRFIVRLINKLNEP
jgi:hypothetical protein